MAIRRLRVRLRWSRVVACITLTALGKGRCRTIWIGNGTGCWMRSVTSCGSFTAARGILGSTFGGGVGLLRLEPFSEGLRDRIWWGAGSDATAVWAAKRGMNLQSSTLKNDESGAPFHVQQAAQIRAFRAAWAEAGHTRSPRVSVSRSIFALIDDRDRAYFGRGGDERDHRGYIAADTRAIFGRGYAAEPDVLVEELRRDDAIAEADTLLLTVPNQLGVDYNAHVIEAILTHVAPALGWR